MTTREKTGGRTKGTPNKNTNEIREHFQNLISNNLEQIESDLRALEPKDRIKFIIDFAKFVVPTMKATELSTSTENEFNPIIISFVEPND